MTGVQTCALPIYTKKVIKRLKPKALGSWPVNQIAEDAEGNLWFGLTGRIVKWTKHQTIKDEDFTIVSDVPLGLQTIYFDNHNKLWVGTRENGILEYDISKEKVIKEFENGSV